MTRAERKILRQAAKIIARELTNKQEVNLPLFGKFYVTKITVYENQHPMAEEGWGAEMIRPRYVARFRSFGCLKAKLKKIAMAEWHKEQADELDG